MRVALVSFEVAGVRGGGIGTYVAEAGHALTAAGHHVTLVTTAGETAEEQRALRQHEAFSEVLLIDTGQAGGGIGHFAFAQKTYAASMGAFEVLRQAAQPFDYIEFAEFEAYGYVTSLEQDLFGTLGDALVALVLHSPTYECFEYNLGLHALRPHQRELCALEDEAIRRAPQLWTPSRRLREMVVERLGLPASTDIPIIWYPMRIPVRDLPERPARRALGDLRIIYFGRIEPRKGLRQLVAAFRQLPDLRLTCFGGDGTSAPLGTSEVEYLVGEGVDNVVFPGPLSRPQMLAELESADLVILPSPWENWPNTCIEAMAAGCVVLGGSNGGMGEMIEHGVSGFLCDGADPDDIVRVIRGDVAASLDRFPVIGAAAAARIRLLSEPSKYVAAIEQLVARSRRALPCPEPVSGIGVSLVISYDQESVQGLGSAVDAALGQTVAVTEILLVGHGSVPADLPADLLDRFSRHPIIRRLDTPQPSDAAARNLALEAAGGDFVLITTAAYRLRQDYVECGLRAFERRADAQAVVGIVAVADDRSGTPRVHLGPIPFDPAMALLRNTLGEAGGMFRRAVFDDHGLRFDGMVDPHCDWAMWLDMARAGLEIQCLPRVTCDSILRSADDPKMWDQHLFHLGLLVERHLSHLDERGQQALLTNLIQGWGIGAVLAAMGTRLEARHALASSKQGGDLVSQMAFSFARVIDRSRLARLILVPPIRWLLRSHGRYKDWRRRRAPDKR